METQILFRIKPVDKKSIEIFYDVYRVCEDGTTVGWTVTELYRWGQAFAETEDELPYSNSHSYSFSPNVGDGCELEDNISTDFQFDDEITEEEREHIENCWVNGDPDDEYNRCNIAWLYDGEHDWQIESEYVIVYGPYTVDKITYSDYTIVSEESVELKPSPFNGE